MKKNLLLFATLFTLTAKAQTNVYHPFPDSNATWCCQMLGLTSPDCYRNWTTYQMNGQAQISTHIYNRLEVYSFDIHYVQDIHFLCVEQDTTISSSALYFRQDTSLKMIWIYDSTTFADRVLYDFNLNLGDTLDTSKAYFANGFGGYKIITSIDSVLINGSYRKRFNYNSGCNSSSTDTSMIEGIGALHGLLSPPSCFEFSFLLNAMAQDNIVLIGDTTGACHDFTSGIDALKLQNSISIFPNPTSSKLSIISSTTKISQLKIFDLIGKELFSQTISGFKKEIDIRFLSSGIYFLHLQTEQGSVVKKFIKE